MNIKDRKENVGCKLLSNKICLCYNLFDIHILWQSLLGIYCYDPLQNRFSFVLKNKTHFHFYFVWHVSIWFISNVSEVFKRHSMSFWSTWTGLLRHVCIFRAVDSINFDYIRSLVQLSNTSSFLNAWMTCNALSQLSNKITITFFSENNSFPPKAQELIHWKRFRFESCRLSLISRRPFFETAILHNKKIFSV